MTVLSLKEQAEFVRGIVRRTEMRDGSRAAETYLTFDKSDVEKLDAIALRLERIAPFENDIRQMVIGR